METRTEQRLLVAGTWALALVTLYLALDAHWSSEKQLRVLREILWRLFSAGSPRH